MVTPGGVKPLRSQPNSRWVSAAGIAWGVILLSLVPLLLVDFRRLWLYEHYHYFPFVIAAFAYFTRQRWPTEDPAERGAMPKTEFCLLVIGLALLAAATVIWTSWLAAVATIFTIGAAMLRFGGRTAAARLFPVWLLLWFLIPIPLRLDVELIFELQTAASTASSYVLDFMGVNHLLAGHVLEVPGHKFLVEEACSGIQSLFALLAFSAILMILLQRSWLHALLMLAAAVFWATSINIIRITTVVTAYVWFDVDLATAWNHESLGLALYAFAVLMLICTDRLVLFFLESSEDEDLIADYYNSDPFADEQVADGSGSVQTDSSGVIGRPRRLSVAIVFAILFAAIGVTQVMALGLRMDSRRVIGEASASLEGAFHESILPERLGRWQRVAFASDSREMTSNLGARFAAWTLKSEKATAAVYCNYPFLGWHHLPACFQAQGWQIQSMEMVPVRSGTGPEAEIWQLNLVQPTTQMQVRFCQFDSQGNPVRAAGWQFTTWRKLLRHNPAGQLPYLAADTSTYQVVMQVTPATDADKIPAEELTADFNAIQERILKTILERLQRHD